MYIKEQTFGDNTRAFETNTKHLKAKTLVSFVLKRHKESVVTNFSNTERVHVQYASNVDTTELPPFIYVLSLNAHSEGCYIILSKSTENL